MEAIPPMGPKMEIIWLKMEIVWLEMEIKLEIL